MSLACSYDCVSSHSIYVDIDANCLIHASKQLAVGNWCLLYTGKEKKRVVECRATKHGVAKVHEQSEN